MSEDAIMKFILLVEVHFPRPRFNGDEGREALWIRSMRDILKTYEPEILAKAAEAIVRTRDPQKTTTMFPKPAECIRACEDIISHRNRLEMLAQIESEMKKSGGDVTKSIAYAPQALPMFEIKRTDEYFWQMWMDHFRSIGRHDLAGEAETKGVVKVSKRWPSDEAIVFDPPKKSANLLASLPSPKSIAN